MVKRITALVFVLLMLVTGCTLSDSSDPEIPSPMVDPTPAVAAPETTPTDDFPILPDLSHIPYYGDRTKCVLTAEQALAFAASLSGLDDNAFYLVLIDVADSGIPLLLIASKFNDESWDMDHTESEYRLWGYRNGQIKEQIYDLNTPGDSITYPYMVSANGEIMLCSVLAGYGGGIGFNRYTYYPIYGGGWEFDSGTVFIDRLFWDVDTYEPNPELDIFYIIESIGDEEEFFQWNYWGDIDDKEVSRAEFIEREAGHPIGEIIWSFTDSDFESYLTQSFTRTEAESIFLAYAEQMK